MGRKLNEQTAVDAVELIGNQIIIGNGKGAYLKNGVEYPVNAEMATILINKGVARLKV